MARTGWIGNILQLMYRQINLSSFLFLLFLALCLVSCTQPIKNSNSSGKNIICFGDSITKGKGALLGQDYVSVLSRLLGEEVINAGVSGDTTVSALARLEDEVLDKDPYLVIIELGGNDFLLRVSKKTTLKNLENIITGVQNRGSMAALADLSCGIILNGYGKDFKRLAKKTGSIFIPGLLEGILDNPDLKSDQIHPNHEGYKIIARRIYKAIKPYIRPK